eukprot:scaffold3190_cov409-Prasinococcus_capsulatus_cf.AAC.24
MSTSRTVQGSHGKPSAATMVMLWPWMCTFRSEREAAEMRRSRYWLPACRHAAFINASAGATAALCMRSMEVATRRHGEDGRCRALSVLAQNWVVAGLEVGVGSEAVDAVLGAVETPDAVDQQALRVAHLPERRACASHASLSSMIPDDRMPQRAKAPAAASLADVPSGRDGRGAPPPDRRWVRATSPGA